LVSIIKVHIFGSGLEKYFPYSLFVLCVLGGKGVVVVIKPNDKWQIVRYKPSKGIVVRVVD